MYCCICLSKLAVILLPAGHRVNAHDGLLMFALQAGKHICRTEKKAKKRFSMNSIGYIDKMYIRQREFFYLIYFCNKVFRDPNHSDGWSPFLHEPINLIWLLITCSWLNTARLDCNQPCWILNLTSVLTVEQSPQSPFLQSHYVSIKRGSKRKWERNMLYIYRCRRGLQSQFWRSDWLTERRNLWTVGESSQEFSRDAATTPGSLQQNPEEHLKKCRPLKLQRKVSVHDSTIKKTQMETLY